MGTSDEVSAVGVGLGSGDVDGSDRGLSKIIEVGVGEGTSVGTAVNVAIG